jgi:hypothetical protein
MAWDLCPTRSIAKAMDHAARLFGSRTCQPPRPCRALARPWPCLLLLCATPVAGQTLISAEPITVQDTAWLHTHGVPGATNGVHVLRFTYWTPDLNGQPSVASAAFVDPDTNCAVPLLCFIHGTEFLKVDVPSYWQEGIGGVSEGYTFGGHGMACVLPDLLGLGISPSLHPYLHVASEATACMDAVRAAREYRQQQGEPLNDQLFLVGASAGAHACLATAKVMQEQYPDEFHITAAAGMDGPYSIQPVIRDEMIDGTYDPGAANLVYILLSYNEAYPALFSSYSDFLVPPYDTEIPPLYDGEHDKDTIEPLLPDVFSTMIPAPLLSSLSSDPDAPLNLAFKENTPTDWAPDFPVKLCYCTSDHFVAPQNSLLAVSNMEAHGATQITTLMPSDTADHGECGYLAEPAVLEWILSMKAGCNDAVPEHTLGKDGLSLWPNPASSGEVTLHCGRGTMPGPTRVRLVDATGHALLEHDLTVAPDGNARIDVNGLEPGVWDVEVVRNGTSMHGMLVVAR